MFGVGGPLATQSSVRSCLSLMVLFGGGEAVNFGETTQNERVGQFFIHLCRPVDYACNH